MSSVLNLKLVFRSRISTPARAWCAWTRQFLEHLDSADAGLLARLNEARGGGFTRKLESELMIDLAPHVEDFIGDLFGIAPKCGRCKPGTTRWNRCTR